MPCPPSITKPSTKPSGNIFILSSSKKEKKYWVRQLSTIFSDPPNTDRPKPRSGRWTHCSTRRQPGLPTRNSSYWPYRLSLSTLGRTFDVHENGPPKERPVSCCGSVLREKRLSASRGCGQPCPPCRAGSRAWRDGPYRDARPRAWRSSGSEPGRYARRRRHRRPCGP